MVLLSRDHYPFSQLNIKHFLMLLGSLEKMNARSGKEHAANSAHYIELRTDEKKELECAYQNNFKCTDQYRK